MLLKQALPIAIGVSIGIGVGVGIRPAVAQEGSQKTLTVRDFPDLMSGLKATPGCMEVKNSTFNGGKQLAIYAWFKNKAAVNAWYHSPMHRDAMKRFFPKLPGKPASLDDFKDEKAPLLVVATVTPSEKPTIDGSPLAVSQIAIEIYTPVPGGVAFGGSFGPKDMDVPGITRM
ncbi:MAG: hypothetical protein H7Y17_11995 [Chlorobia bacterium]|nr:hypothetical protein [Fimbriimonadaceae bacterium]